MQRGVLADDGGAEAGWLKLEIIGGMFTLVVSLATEGKERECKRGAREHKEKVKNALYNILPDHRT